MFSLFVILALQLFWNLNSCFVKIVEAAANVLSAHSSVGGWVSLLILTPGLVVN